MQSLVAIGGFQGSAFGFFGGLGICFIGFGGLWWISPQEKWHKH